MMLEEIADKFTGMAVYTDELNIYAHVMSVYESDSGDIVAYLNPGAGHKEVEVKASSLTLLSEMECEGEKE